MTSCLVTLPTCFSALTYFIPNVSQKKPFLPQVALVRYFIRASKKVTNTDSNCGQVSGKEMGRKNDGEDIQNV